MKISKEDFRKLKQLDRIEYRQKHRVICEEWQTGAFWSLMKTYIGIAIFLSSFSILLVAINPDYVETARTLIGVIYKLIWVPLVGILIDLIISAGKGRLIERLNKEYFEVKTK